ncbi:MAG TPA: hypothetical protein VHY56_13245, partial [Candidatus Binataceae bacterium]|nr:hypothetical protein [Candidatus Binataceae bacterium]
MLTLVVLAAAGWALLSLFGMTIGRRTNPGGPLGQTLAEALARTLGYQAYIAVVFWGLFGWRLWKAPPVATLMREVSGGVAVILA